VLLWSSRREVHVSEVVHLAEVSIRRGGAWLLKDVTWVVHEGQRWVIIGPNGAGKSTLLRIASAQMHPTTGVAVILDEFLGLTNVFELRTRIGLVGAGFADTIPANEKISDLVLTASWGVAGRGRERYDTADVARAEFIINSVGLGKFAHRTYATLSDGERKRAQIARALMTDPELLLLDEPAAGLDLGGREQLLATLSEMAANPDAGTLVMVTHHVEEIPPGTTHALVLANGRVHSQGLIKQVLTDQVLSDVYGVPLTITFNRGRWSARAAQTPETI